MAQIRDIMQKKVITVESKKSSLDAAKILKEKDISFLVVINQNVPVGIITERDLVRKIVAENKDPSKTPISDIMSHKFRSVEPTTEIEDAVQKMLNYNIRRLVVLENNKLVGVVTQTDLTGYLRSKLLIKGTVDNINDKN